MGIGSVQDTYPRGSAGGEDAVLAEAKAAIGAGDWQHGAELFAQLLSSSEHCAEAYYGLGMIALAFGRRSQAVELFQSALAHDPRHTNAMYQLAKLQERSAPASAEAIYEQILAINPSHVSARDRYNKLSRAHAVNLLSGLQQARGPAAGVDRPASDAGLSVAPRSSRMQPEAPAFDERVGLAADVPDTTRRTLPSEAGEYTTFGIEEYLRKDPSPASKQAVELIDQLDFSVTRLSFSACFDRLLNRAIGLSGLALLSSSAMLVSWRAGSGSLTGPEALGGLGVVLLTLTITLELIDWHRRRTDEPGTKSLLVPAKWLAAAIVLAGVAVAVGVSRRGAHVPPPTSTVLTAAMGATAAVWLASALYELARAWTTTVHVANARIYEEAGVLAKHSRAVDLWLVQQIEIDRSLVNRITGDGTIIFKLPQDMTFTIAGLRKGAELESLYKRLQDLRFLLRANAVVKGIVQ